MSSHTSSMHHSLMIAWARNLQAGAPGNRKFHGRAALNE